MNKPGVMIYFTMRPSRKLPMEDRLRLYDAMLDYGETGVVPELEGPLAVLWDYFQPQLELDNARYESIRAKRAKAGRLGGLACQGSRQPEQEPQDGQEEANEANEANTIQSSTVQSNPVQLRESIRAAGAYGPPSGPSSGRRHASPSWRGCLPSSRWRCSSPGIPEGPW